MHFKYELKKCLFSKSFFIVFAILLTINGINCTKYIARINVADSKQYIRAREELYNRIEGQLSVENVKEIVQKKNELEAKVEEGDYSDDYDSSTITGYTFSDYNLYTEVFDKIKYITEYRDNMDTIIHAAKENTSFYKEIGDNYQEKKYQNIVELYEKRNISEIYDTKGFENYFEYETSDIMILILIILAISPIFSNERETKNNILLLTGKRGKGKTFVYKIIATVIVSVFIAAMFYLEDYIIFHLRMDMNGYYNPLYSIEKFKYTQFNGSIGQFIILSILIKMLGFVAIGIMTSFASSIGTKNIISAGIATLLSTVMIAVSENQKIFNFVKLLSIQDRYCQYNAFNIVGTAMPDIFLYVMTTGVFIIVIISITFLIECRAKKVFGNERI